MQRFLDYLRSKWESFKDSLTLKNVLIFILAAFSILAICVLIIWGFQFLLAFIVKHMTELILGGSILFGFYYLVKSLQSKEEQKRFQEEQEILQQKEAQQARNEQLLHERRESTYKLFREYLFHTVNDLKQLTHLPTLHTMSELDAPEHHLNHEGLCLFQYLVAKGECMLSSDELYELFSRRIQQKVENNEFFGLNPPFYTHTSGVTYPGMYLYSIVENVGGGYYQIYLVVPCQRLHDLLQASLYRKAETSQVSVNQTDNEF